MPYSREEHKDFEALRLIDRDPAEPSLVVPQDVQGVKGILEYVTKRTGLPIQPLPSPAPEGPPQEFGGTHMGQPFRFDVSGWQIIGQGGQQDEDGDVTGPILRRRLGRRRVGATLIRGMDPPGERLVKDPDALQRTTSMTGLSTKDSSRALRDPT